VERRAGAKGNTHQHNTYWTQSQARVTNALERMTAGTPKDAVEKLNAEVQRAVRRPELRKRLIAAGMEPPPPQDPAEFRKFVENDIARWAQFVEAVGVEKLKGDVPAQ
jgi:tripartite-type tricarboxylate transporter receptor subunit TctC